MRRCCQMNQKFLDFLHWFHSDSVIGQKHSSACHHTHFRIYFHKAFCQNSSTNRHLRSKTPCSFLLPFSLGYINNHSVTKQTNKQNPQKQTKKTQPKFLQIPIVTKDVICTKQDIKLSHSHRGNKIFSE